jgi:hypothetical protein
MCDKWLECEVVAYCMLPVLVLLRTATEFEEYYHTKELLTVWNVNGSSF